MCNIDSYSDSPKGNLVIGEFPIGELAIGELAIGISPIGISPIGISPIGNVSLPPIGNVAKSNETHEFPMILNNGWFRGPVLDHRKWHFLKDSHYK